MTRIDPPTKTPTVANRTVHRGDLTPGHLTPGQWAGGISLCAFLLVVALLGWRSFTTLGSTGPSALGSSVDTSMMEPQGTTPPPTGLEPGLVEAFDEAQAAASEAGHSLTITSGYRTAARQQELLDEAIRDHGSEEEALRWVFPPDRSMHVQGLAIDVGDGPAADWLEAEGSAFGLCRTLEWEWWHFEWRAGWQQSGSCPRPATDPDDVPTTAITY